MLNKLAAGAVLGLACASAIAEPGGYAGIDIGDITLEDSIGTVEIKRTGTAFRLFGGYRVNDYFSVEFAYHDGESAKDTVRGVRFETDATALAASALVRNPMGTYFETYLRASLIAWDADNLATDGRTRIAQSNDGVDGGYGIGVLCKVTPKLGLRVEYAGAEFDGTEFRSLGVGGVFTF